MEIISISFKVGQLEDLQCKARKQKIINVSLGEIAEDPDLGEVLKIWEVTENKVFEIYFSSGLIWRIFNPLNIMLRNE